MELSLDKQTNITANTAVDTSSTKVQNQLCRTQMTVGFRFMENKSNEEKAKLLRDIWLEQGKHADSIVSEFVATDNPKGDESMIIRVHSECFQGLPHAGRVTVGDDVWHTKDRIARRLPRRQLPAKKALKQVLAGSLQWGTISQIAIPWMHGSSYVLRCSNMSWRSGERSTGA